MYHLDMRNIFGLIHFLNVEFLGWSGLPGQYFEKQDSQILSRTAPVCPFLPLSAPLCLFLPISAPSNLTCIASSSFTFASRMAGRKA